MRIVKLLILVLSLSLFSCKQSNEKESVKVSDKESYNLSGNVKRLEEKSFRISADEIISVPQRENRSEHNFILEFDQKGKLVLQQKFLMNGNLHEEHRYDGKDHPLSFEQFHENQLLFSTNYSWDEFSNNTLVVRKDKEGTELSKTVNVYNNTLLTEMQRYNGGRITEKINYIHDTEGKVVEERRFRNGSLLVSRIRYNYDDRGNKISEEQFDRNERPIYKTIYEYDSKNRVTDINSYNPEGKLLYYEKKEYDKAGNIVQIEIKDLENNIHIREEQKFNQYNKIISHDTYQNENLLSHALYEYNDRQNVIKNVQKDPDTNNEIVKTYTYQYDDKGNWIEKITAIDGIPQYKVTRTIQYH